MKCYATVDNYNGRWYVTRHEGMVHSFTNLAGYDSEKTARIMADHLNAQYAVPAEPEPVNASLAYLYSL